MSTNKIKKNARNVNFVSIGMNILIFLSLLLVIAVLGLVTYKSFFPPHITISVNSLIPKHFSSTETKMIGQLSECTSVVSGTANVSSVTTHTNNPNQITSARNSLSNQCNSSSLSNLLAQQLAMELSKKNASISSKINATPSYLESSLSMVTGISAAVFALIAIIITILTAKGFEIYQKLKEINNKFSEDRKAGFELTKMHLALSTSQLKLTDIFFSKVFQTSARKDIFKDLEVFKVGSAKQISDLANSYCQTVVLSYKAVELSINYIDQVIVYKKLESGFLKEFQEKYEYKKLKKTITELNKLRESLQKLSISSEDQNLEMGF